MMRRISQMALIKPGVRRSRQYSSTMMLNRIIR